MQGARCKKSIGFVESIESAESKGRGARHKVYGAGLSRKLSSGVVEIVGFIGNKKPETFAFEILCLAPCTMHRVPPFICSPFQF